LKWWLVLNNIAIPFIRFLKHLQIKKKQVWQICHDNDNEPYWYHGFVFITDSKLANGSIFMKYKTWFHVCHNSK
jgi:hypothetical protein